MNILPVYPQFMTRGEIQAKCGALRDIMERESDNLYIFVVILGNQDTHANVTPKRVVNFFANTGNIHYQATYDGDKLAVINVENLGKIEHRPSLKSVFCTISNLESCITSLFEERGAMKPADNKDLQILSNMIREGKI